MTPCATVCDAPPAAVCADASTLRVFAAPGLCEADGACAYPQSEVACPLGCADGACQGDPCAGITCDAPPSACHAATGACQGGVCHYAVLTGAACDDGDGCTLGDVCDVNGACAGASRACQSPPAPRCADASSLVVPAATGACGADGACTYAETTVPCAEGCAEGACLGDPCAGVTCDAPPSACHEARGACQNGVCAYPFDNGASCDDGDACTTGDTCRNGGCAGAPIACTTPPGATCADGDTLSTPRSPGTCAAGSCSYASEAVPCAHGCEGGACHGDPCAGVTCATPPAARCTDAWTLETYAATGTCSGGVCSYGVTTAGCPHGCASAACAAPVGLVISELLYDSAGYPDTDSYLELHGPPGLELTGVEIVGVNGNGGGVYVTIPLTGELDSDGLFLVAHPDAADAIALAADVLDDAIDLQNGPDSVQLRYRGVVLDALAYGTFSGGTVAAGEGAPHAGTRVGESLGRDADYTDTDDNAADFTAGPGTPGAPNAPAELAPRVVLACPAGGAVTGQVLAFDATGTTGDVAALAFTLGPDGASAGEAVGRRLERSFAEAGDYVVTATATSPTGAVDQGSCAVAVVEAPGTALGGGEVCGGAASGGYVEHDVAGAVPAVGAVRIGVRYAAPAATPAASRFVWELETAPGAWTVLGQGGDVGAAGGFLTASLVIEEAAYNDALAAVGGLVIRRGALAGAGGADCDTLTVWLTPAETPVGYDGAEQCFGSGTSAYLYDVISNPAAATTDGVLTLRFRGSNPYGPRPYTFEFQTGANTWVAVATTVEASETWREQRFIVSASLLNQAMGAMGWLRFRHSYLYNGAPDNCTQLTLRYNCPSCLLCPPGEEDLGIGCRPTTAPYDFTLIEGSAGRCSQHSGTTLTFEGVPAAAGDGTFSVEYLGCGSPRVSVTLQTLNSGWVDIGAASGGDCGYAVATFTVAEAYLDAAVTAGHKLAFKALINDHCMPGTGCSGYNDPCFRNARLTFPR